MEIDTFPPQFAVTSKPLVPLPAQYLPRLDVLGQGKLPPKYQSHYLPDAYFPPAGPRSSSSGRSSSFPGLQNMNKTLCASQDRGTAKAVQIAQPQPSSMTMSANLYTTPFFFQPPPNPRPNPPTIYGRMATPAGRQRTTQACNNCRDRKTKCSGKHPVCQRCSARGLICHYTAVSSRDTRLRNLSRVRYQNSSLAIRSPEVDSHIDMTASSVRATTAILAPQPVRPSVSSPPLNAFPGTAISQRWVPSTQPILCGAPLSERLDESRSALGLTGIFTKPSSTITPGFTSSPHNFAPRATKDASPMVTSMFNQYIVTSPSNFNLGQCMSWDSQNDQINGFRYQPMSATNSSHSSTSSNSDPSHSGFSGPLDQYTVPLVEQESNTTAALNSSPTSSYSPSSPFSMNSTSPSSVTSSTPTDLPVVRTTSLTTQAQYLPGEDFSFANDPVYYEYLVKSTMTGDSFGKKDLRSTFSSAQSMELQYPIEL